MLTQAQQAQVAMQLKRHDRGDVTSKINLGDKEIELVVQRGVFGSDIMSSAIYLARFLYAHRELYQNKDCLDMGCGPGIQGLVMAEYGARQVDLADINEKAVKNTGENVRLHRLEDKASAYVSDLFSGLKDKEYEVVVFNHPFFPEEAKNFGQDAFQDEVLRRSMLGGTELVKRFFKDVRFHLSEGGLIIMPYFHFAGKENDPANHVNNYGFKIISEEKIRSEKGLQLGDISIYTIKAK